MGPPRDRLQSRDMNWLVRWRESRARKRALRTLSELRASEDEETAQLISVFLLHPDPAVRLAALRACLDYGCGIKVETIDSLRLKETLTPNEVVKLLVDLNHCRIEGWDTV